jgi:hypothetical protein
MNIVTNFKLSVCKLETSDTHLAIDYSEYIVKNRLIMNE